MKFLPILIAMLIPALSYSYEIKKTETGNPVRWEEGTEIIVSLDPSLEDLNSTAYTTAEDSFNEWVDYMEGAVIVRFIKQTCTDSSMFCIKYGQAVESCGDLAMACTRRTYNSTSGELVTVSIQIFDNYSWSTVGELRNAMLHEIGHGMGLTHSLFKSAVMYHMASPRNSALSQDDINGIMTLYTEKEHPSVEETESIPGCSLALFRPAQNIYSLFF